MARAGSFLSQKHTTNRLISVGVFAWLMATTFAVAGACRVQTADEALESSNPIKPNAAPPFGMEEFFRDAPQPLPARVRLGRWLFFDSRLSGDGTVSCATCHRPEYAFADVVANSIGVGGQRGQRKSPSLVNLASRTVVPGIPDVGATFFWDGRATSLEEQALMPIENPTEMGLDHSAMISRLSSIDGYRRYFAQAFGSGGITKDRVAAAIADYVRRRMSGNSPFDRWQFGKNPAAMSAEAQRGYGVFTFKGRCETCHIGSDFSDGNFHNLGVGWDEATQTFRDQGRKDGRFKTPRLRDVAKHPPYMHDGSLKTLREVVEFYNRGGVANPWRSARLSQRPLDLSEKEIDALVAFLESLSGEGYDDARPTLFPR